MLTQIEIRNFAIVDHLSLDFKSAMSVLTGETGAGKSILIHALNLVLGDRADADFVRSGAEKCEIAVNFDLASHASIRNWLIEHELEADGECQLRRVITREGRSKGFINNSLVPSQSLRALGDMLVDIQGQQQNQALLRRDYQREVVDDFGRHQNLCKLVASCYQEWSRNQHRLEQLQGGTEEHKSRIDLLQYQLEELNALNLDAKELASIDQEFQTLSHAQEWIQTCGQGTQLLYEDEDNALYGRLSCLLRELEPIIAVQTALVPCGELINSALIQMEEAAQLLRNFISGLDTDPEKLNWLEERIEAIERIARKHRVRAEELPSLQASLAQELHDLLHASEEISRIQMQQKQLEQQYQEEATKLHAKRKQTALTLSKEISARMQRLGMKGGKLSIEISTKKDVSPSPYGLDEIQFLVSPNPGQPLKPLAKIASGGELSRISLAIQVIAARADGPPTLIFDEVDTGVGGEIADCIGKELRLLSRQHQVVCITHLPQVASFAHHHYQVRKVSSKSETETRVICLNEVERIDEIGRMLGGGNSALSHAQAMLERSQLPSLVES